MKNSSITIIACLFSVATFAQAPAVGPGVQPQQMQPMTPMPAVGPGANQQQTQPMPQPDQYQQQYDNPPQQDIRHERNESGRDKIAYIDNYGQPATTTAIPYAGTCDPQWLAQWRKEKADGRYEEDGRLYQTFSYMGANGYTYQTRIVATATNDPMNRFTVRFQSKLAGDNKDYGNDRDHGNNGYERDHGDHGNDGRFRDDGFQDGRVIVLDWDRNPWTVDVYYSNDKGIYFAFTPYHQGY